MNGDPPVRFCRSASDDAVPPVSATQALQDAFVDPVLWGALSTDQRVASVAGRGWCLFSPISMTVDPGSERSISPPEATEYVSVESEQTDSETVLLTIDTLWTVETDGTYALLVIPWTGSFGDWVTPQLVTAADGPIDLEVPVAATERVRIDEETPIVQLVPLAEPLLDAPSEAGVSPAQPDEL